LVRLNVTALDAGGHGIARNAEGKVVFVEGALGGETVDAQILRSKPKFDTARTVAVLQAASGRRVPPCPYYESCGGCAIQHADARTQVAAKQRWLEDCFERIGRVRPETMLAPIYGEEWGYRRRARLSVRYVEKKGGAMVGFRERRSTFVTDMQGCLVLPAHVSALIPELRALIGQLYAPAMARFKAAFERALPQMPAEELNWRMHFMFGTLAYTLAATDTVQLIAGCKPEDRYDAKLLEERLTAFLASGLAAPLRAKDSVRKAA